MKTGAHLALGVAVAGLFLWLTLRQVDFAQLRAAARDLSLPWLAGAPLLLAVGYACRIQRWRSMLVMHNPALGFGRCGVAFTASIAVNNLLPFRAGDVLRCFGFSGWLKVRSGPVLATVLVERLLDMVILILSLGLALWVFALVGAGDGLLRFGGVALGALGLVSLGLLLVPRLLGFPLRALVGVAGWFGPTTRAKADALCTPMLDTLIALSQRHAMAGLLGWSVLVWLFEGATYWAIARAVPSLPVPEAAWLVMPVGTLATLLPSTPGHVGTFDYFAQAAAVAAGNPLEAATAFVLIAHAALWLPTTLIGSVSLLIWWLAGRSKPQARQ